MRFCFFVFIIASLQCAVPLAAQEKVAIKLGNGSYTLNRPDGCKPLPDVIYRSSAVAGPTPTNQWWSSLVWERHSQNMFPHPMGVVCFEGGLSIGYPGIGLVAASGNIMGGGISKKGDVVIGHSVTDEFPDTRLAGFSSWFVKTGFAADKAELQTSFGHGSPFIFCRIKGGKPRLRFAIKPVVWSGDAESHVLGITVRGSHYGLFGASGSKWNRSKPTEFINDTGQDYFTVALLPDNRAETLKLFSNHAHNHVVDTQLTYEVDQGQIVASYQFSTSSLEKSAAGTIFSLYPHQWKNVQLAEDAKGTGLAYRSVRGTMKVVTGEGFQTSIPVQGVLPMLPKEGIPNRKRMLAYLTKEAEKRNASVGDTYWEGKHLGKLATLSGIAESIDAPELQKKFVSELRARLENWFTASKSESSPLLYYDKSWGTLIGNRPSYGSDSELNDHHFHYGYFIRAAAEVARLDRDWARRWGPMVELMIRDIASAEGDDMFPRLRCFDAYAGHSWASGHAKFGDGNNIESSSEALNAWYGIMEWGEITGNRQLRDQGVFLFNTERTSVEEYWFDVSDTNFPKDFPNVALGMIWGGKGAFATWFSGEIDHIHGINWLPFTPASIYMGRHPEYVRKNHDRVIAKRKHGRDYNKGWGDLLLMFGALADPASAAKYIDTNPDGIVEAGNTRAFMYHWIQTLNELGLNDASVTADHPFVNVYNKGGKRTYAAYNFGEIPLDVRFSDGTTMSAAPGRVTLQPNRE